MHTSTFNIWWPRGASFVLAALAAASASFWALKIYSIHPANAAITTAQSAVASLDSAAVARALGGGAVVAPIAPAASLASRFTLAGIVADQNSAGVALLSVDGNPAKPFRVGALVNESLVLQSVLGRKATLGSAVGAPPVLALELPPLKQ
jgi:general secretion pathway protein C